MSHIARKVFAALAALAPWSSGHAKPIPAELDEPAFLRAIAQRETGDDARAIGPCGERSKYQFTRDTWRLHSHRPFALATDDPVLADAIARRHLAYLRSVLRIQKVAETPAALAAAWHYGPKFAHVCLNTDYVRGVVNLYGVEVRK